MSLREEMSSSLPLSLDGKVEEEREKFRSVVAKCLTLFENERTNHSVDNLSRYDQGIDLLKQLRMEVTSTIEQQHESDSRLKQQKEQEIWETMRFYFSNSSLSKDRFLKREIEKSVDGWLPLSLFTSSFNKLKSITQDPQFVADVLEKHKAKQEVGEWSFETKKEDDSLFVRRTGGFPSSDSDLSLDATIYVHNIPRDASHQSLSSLFSPYGAVIYVSIPKDPFTQDNKGYAFVEFSSRKDANKLLDSWKFAKGDDPMVVLPKRAWIASKKNAASMKFIDPYQRGRSSRQQGSVKFTPGVVVRVNSVGANISRNQMRSFFEEFGNVNYVDHTIGQSSAHIRFSLPTEATFCIEELQKRETHIEDNRFEASILEGEEEEEYWKKLRAFRNVVGGGFKAPQKRKQKWESQPLTPTEDEKVSNTVETHSDSSRKKTDEKTKKRKTSKGGVKRTHIIFSEASSDEEPIECSSKLPTSPPTKRAKKEES